MLRNHDDSKKDPKSLSFQNNISLNTGNFCILLGCNTANMTAVEIPISVNDTCFGITPDFCKDTHNYSFISMHTWSTKF